MGVDPAKARREHMRWLLILTLNNARPVGAFEEVILSTVQAMYPDATQLEVRRELDYLADRKLAQVRRQPDGRWFAELTRFGVDLAEYTIACEPGIARPAKYWA